MNVDTIIFYIMIHDDKYIPKNDLNNGSGIALDNSRKFSQSMKYLYDGKFYESGTIIGTLALEEFGKYLYLLKQYNNDGLITHKDKIFHDHNAKLDALVEDYRGVANQNDLRTVKNDLRTLKNLRFRLLYAEWDNVQKKWLEPSLDHNVIKYMNNIQSYGSDPEENLFVILSYNLIMAIWPLVSIMLIIFSSGSFREYFATRRNRVK